MLDLILIMNEGGLLLFEWSPFETPTTGDLISGFLTAINMFAKGERGENIKKITLDPTTFFFERESNLIFTILTKDTQFEKIILKIITDIKKEFLSKYRDILADNLIDVHEFNNFKPNLEKVLNSYGYFDYRDIVSSFEQKDPLKSLILIDKISGNFDYVKSKVFFNRDILGIQADILLGSLRRIVNRILSQNLEMAVIIYSSRRYLFFKDSGKIVQIHELYEQSNSKIPKFEIKDRKIEKILKSPRNLILKIIEPFILYDSSGNILISNDEDNSLNKDEISSDCVTSINSTGRISDIYKEPIFALYIFSDSDMYSIFPISNMITFLKLTMKLEYYKLLKKAWFKLKDVEPLSDIETKVIEENITTVLNFINEFN